jgi:chemotaxis signal transduction protein
MSSTLDHIAQEPGPQQARRLWCYLVALRGELYAVPDEARAVLLPHIGRLPRVTPLPFGLVRPCVLGLVNVNQRGEVLIDLAAYLGLPGEPALAEQRCVLVIGESSASGLHDTPRQEPYRLAFAVDAGYELAEVECGSRSGDDTGALVRDLVQTRRGQAALLDMETICQAIVSELGAERPWNASAALKA